MRRLPKLKLVVVARPENLVGLDVPDNVVVHKNIPLSQVWNIIAHAKLMVLPARDAEVPCGHGTLLIAMKLDTPSILTESMAMTDYITPEETGLVCPPANPAAMAETIERLWDDGKLASSIVRTARKFAAEECSEQRTINYFRDYLRGHGLL
jgi:glycosyltransferase involved in cell wall biosynthesis